MKTFKRVVMLSAIMLIAQSQPVMAGVRADQTEKFITLCSGLELNSETAKSIAASSCMSRIVGYADGHRMTVELSKAAAKDVQSKSIMPLWCIPNNATDKYVFESVLMWIRQDPIMFNQLTTRYKGLGGAMAVVTKSLHETFPCKD